MTVELSWREAGCRRSCDPVHSHTWGECAYAAVPPPRPRLHRLDVVTGGDGRPALAGAELDPEAVADWLRGLGYTVTGGEAS